jgi:hypothetical protein
MNEYYKTISLNFFQKINDRSLHYTLIISSLHFVSGWALTITIRERMTRWWLLLCILLFLADYRAMNWESFCQIES